MQNGDTRRPRMAWWFPWHRFRAAAADLATLVDCPVFFAAAFQPCELTEGAMYCSMIDAKGRTSSRLWNAIELSQSRRLLRSAI